MDFVLGPGFTVLYDVVKEAMGGKVLSFKPLEDLKSTLDSLHPLTIQQIGELNIKLSLSTVDVENLAKQMMKGAELVPKFSKLQTWNCILKCRYTGELVKLDGCLKTLVEKLNTQDSVVARKALILARQTQKKLDKLLEELEKLKQSQKNEIINLMKQIAEALARLEAATATATATATTSRPSRRLALEAPKEAENLLMGSDKSEQSVELDGSFLGPFDTDLEAHQEESEFMQTVFPISNKGTGMSVVQETRLFAGHTLGAAFKVLFDVLMDVKEKTTLFKPLLEGIKSTLDSLEPLIEEREKYKVLDLPKVELKHFENQMKNGAVLVQKCTEVSPWKIYMKHKYAKKLLELDNSLRRLFEIFRVSEIRDVMERVRNISTEVSQIEYEIHASQADGAEKKNNS